MTPLEAAIAAAVEPLLDEIIRLERAFKALPAPQPGAPGAPGVGLEVEAWQPGVYREGVIVGHYLGILYRARRDTAEEPGNPGSDHWDRLGRLGLRWRGVLEEGAACEPGDLYIRDSSLFLVDWNNQANMITFRGKKGARGDPGAPGKDGASLLDVRAEGDLMVFDLGELGVRTIDLAPLVERLATALIVREVAPLLEQIGQRLVDLERGL